MKFVHSLPSLVVTTLLFVSVPVWAQTSSNPMRRLLGNESRTPPAASESPANTPRPSPTPAATPRPVATPRDQQAASGTDRNRTRTRATPTPRPTPDPQAALIKTANDATTVVARFLQHANDGKYSEARQLLTPEVQAYFDSEFAPVYGDIMTILDRITQDGQLTLIRYPLANVRGEGITVVADMQYKDGTTDQRRFRVFKVGRNLRIALDIAQFATVPSLGVPSEFPSPVTPSPQPVKQETPAVVSSSSEDILTGSGVVTRPGTVKDEPLVQGIRQASRNLEPINTPKPGTEPQADDSSTTGSDSPPSQGLQDRPWQPANPQ